MTINGGLVWVTRRTTGRRNGIPHSYPGTCKLYYSGDQFNGKAAMERAVILSEPVEWGGLLRPAEYHSHQWPRGGLYGGCKIHFSQQQSHKSSKPPSRACWWETGAKKGIINSLWSEYYFGPSGGGEERLWWVLVMDFLWSLGKWEKETKWTTCERKDNDPILLLFVLWDRK